ncbi:MAG: cytochrome c [Enhygromyxa sp.]
MEKSRTRIIRGGLAGVVATLLLILLVVIAVAYTGAYDIAASSGHTAATRWFLDTTLQASVRRRAEHPYAEQRLARASVAAGAVEYVAMCEQCHGGPGVEPHSWTHGMLPVPPPLDLAADRWEPAEVVWIVRHGLKYTGMPAFGADHDDETLWNIAAFVEELPAMTPNDYWDHRHAGDHQ